MIPYLLLFIVVFPVVVNVFVLIITNTTAFQKQSIKGEGRPQVSVLIAARNEEDNIRRCIESLLLLDYPIAALEILVGDDASEDNTFQIVSDFAKSHSHIQVFKINGAMGNQKGKASVLAQLAHRATGDYFFFTDADIAVPRNWVRGLLGGFSNHVGIVCGVTGVSGSSYWSRFQNMDWIIGLGMIKALEDLGISAAVIGNNMAVSRAAYQAVGGYENIPFSITEDFELLKQVKLKGFTSKQLFMHNVLAHSLPEQTVLGILHQRKRWMRGAVQLPFFIVFILLTQAISFFAVGLLIVLAPLPGIIMWGLKLITQALLAYFLLRKLKQKESLFTLFLYDFYAAVLSLSLLCFYMLPTRIIWKGRKY